jgi:3-oxoacyl-[acyl-carrier-protein] synthase II
MLAGGAEAPIVPILFHSLGTIGATSTRNDEAHKASRPFDADRDGFVPAEGGAVLVLEEMQFAIRRGARIHAEVAGYASTGDAYHVTSPSPSGEGAARCMRLAIQDAGMNPREVDYINAHGTSTKLNDSTETVAIKKVFGEHASRIPISSNKSMLGHSLGASGPVEAVFTILTMNEGVIPPTINYDTPDPECDLDYVPNVARKAKVRTALSNSFGFGGTNGVLVLRQFDDQY